MLLMAVSPALAQSAQAPLIGDNPALPELGLWTDHTGTGVVEIQPCGAKLCGSIVWLEQPVDAKGSPVTDTNNPEAGKKKRPICGLQIIGNLVRQGDGSWDKGWIYDPNTGETFDLAISIKSAERLTVTGYLGLKMLGEKFAWSRVPTTPPLTRCGAQAATKR